MSAVTGYFAMGGYAAYVWPAYGIAAAVIAGFTWRSWRRYRDSERTLARLQRRPRPSR